MHHLSPNGPEIRWLDARPLGAQQNILGWPRGDGQLPRFLQDFSSLSRLLQDLSNFVVICYLVASLWHMVTLASCACSCCVATLAAAANDMMPSTAQECKAPLNVILNLRYTEVHRTHNLIKCDATYAHASKMSVYTDITLVKLSYPVPSWRAACSIVSSLSETIGDHLDA